MSGLLSRFDIDFDQVVLPRLPPLLKEATIVPAANQVELHPYLQQVSNSRISASDAASDTYALTERTPRILSKARYRPHRLLSFRTR